MEAGFSALETTTPESYGRPKFRWCFTFWNLPPIFPSHVLNGYDCAVPFLRSEYLSDWRAVETSTSNSELNILSQSISCILHD